MLNFLLIVPNIILSSSASWLGERRNEESDTWEGLFDTHSSSESSLASIVKNLGRSCLRLTELEDTRQSARMVGIRGEQLLNTESTRRETCSYS